MKQWPQKRRLQCDALPDGNEWVQGSANFLVMDIVQQLSDNVVILYQQDDIWIYLGLLIWSYEAIVSVLRDQNS